MSRAALRAGCGLVTAYLPKVGYTVMQTAFPECMVITDDELTEIRHFPKELNAFQSLVVGPGLGIHEATILGFEKWIKQVQQPCVLDADALNCCSRLLLEHHDSFQFPPQCILTPHPKEFDRLAGISTNSFERLEKQVHFAKQHRVVVVLKGAHTVIACPDGSVFYNSTGNVAMATAGSGDALSGIIGALLAQGYHAKQAACIGVFLHGLAGDLVAQNQSTLLASDLIEQIPLAWQKVYAFKGA